MLISRQQVTKTEAWEQQIYGNKFHVPLRLQAAWSAPQQAGVLVWVIYTGWHNGVDHIPEYMSRNYTYYRCHYMSMWNRTRYGKKYDLLHALCTFQQQVFSKRWRLTSAMGRWSRSPPAWPFFPACPRCQEENQHHHYMSKTDQMPHEVATFWSHPIKDPNSSDSSQEKDPLDWVNTLVF